MKLVRVLSRVALLSLAAAAFAGITEWYGNSVRPPRPGPRFRAVHWHRRSEPRPGRFPELIGTGLVMAFFAVGGRIALRLRLSPEPRSEGQPILLGLRCESARDPEPGGRQPSPLQS